MDGLHSGELTMQGATEVYQAAVVEGGAVFGVCGSDILEFGSEHSRGDIAVFDRKCPAEATAAVEVGERGVVEAADFAEETEGAVAQVQSPQTVTACVIGDSVRKIRANVFDAETVNEEFAELINARQQVMKRALARDRPQKGPGTGRESWRRMRRKE